MTRGLNAALSFPSRLGASVAPSPGRPIRVTVRPAGCRRRGLMVVRAGGPPSTNALILAFVLPLSLFVGTLITAARVADDLDERFLREMEINQAIMEENEASGEDSGDEEDDDREYDEGEEEEEDDQPPVEIKEAVVVGAAPRARNRPRRQV
ncbi:uncharacterized protein LOC133909577 [Phragmites australis]|uniref:uncharacterized protein LOC133909577 n=1 Tax=Phragmites australis TaxID=29695 RepID=UPI002D79D5CA|nr:uncharacterized protein LOC133909577 [Phragmites australis]